MTGERKSKTDSSNDRNDRALSPLSPRATVRTVVNRDNEWLEPCGPIGRVQEVNGETAKEVPDFVPTSHELTVLVEYWAAQIIDYNFFLFCYEQTCSQKCRRSDFGQRRVNRIESLIGEAAVQRAIDKALDEYGRGDDSEAWRVFRHGTDEERRLFLSRTEAVRKT